MNKTIKLIAIILVAVLAFVGVYFLYKNLSGRFATDGLVTEKPQPDETISTETGELQEYAYNPAPDFSVTDAQGNKIRLSDMKGKPVVLNFWATWCYYCTVEMPDFEEMYKKYGEDVQFMMVNLTDGKRETVDGAKKYISDKGYTFPVYFDTDSKAAIAYGISGIPATYFIDAEGNLKAYANSMIDMESLKKGIEMIVE